MATVITTKYCGDGLVELVHGPTGKKIMTDLPPDNGGKGREFSPTDLFSASLASCILTIMGKMVERDNLSFEGGEIQIEKVMNESPRRIGKLILDIKYPKSFSEKEIKKYSNAIKACPVHASLHPDIEVVVLCK